MYRHPQSDVMLQKWNALLSEILLVKSTNGQQV